MLATMQVPLAIMDFSIKMEKDEERKELLVVSTLSQKKNP